MASVLGRNSLAISKQVAVNALAVQINLGSLGTLGTMVAFVLAEGEQPIGRFIDLANFVGNSSTVYYISGIPRGNLMLRGVIPMFYGGGGTSICSVGAISISAASECSTNPNLSTAYVFQPTVFSGLMLSIGEENVYMPRHGYIIPLKQTSFQFYGVEAV